MSITRFTGLRRKPRLLVFRGSLLLRVDQVVGFYYEYGSLELAGAGFLAARLRGSAAVTDASHIIKVRVRMDGGKSSPDAGFFISFSWPIRTEIP
jgi:hypothetical protein